MPLTAPQRDFIAKVKIKAEASEQMEKDQLRKSSLIEEALASLPGEEEWRKAFDIKLKSKDGKSDIAMISDNPTKAVESEEASKTQGLTGAQSDAINKMMTEHLFPAIDRLLKQKNDINGDLFDANDITDEIFEPLRRRGLFPETLIPDKYSVVQKYIDAALKGYKDRLAEERQAKIQAEADAELKAMGLEGVKGKLEGKAAQLQKLGDRALTKLGPKGKTLEEKQRSFKLAMTATSTVATLASTGLAIKSAATGTTEASAERSITPSNWGQDGQGDALTGAGGTSVTAQADQLRYVSSYGKYIGEAFPDNPVLAAEIIEMTLLSEDATETIVGGVIEGVLTNKDIDKYAEQIKNASRQAGWETRVSKAMREVPAAIDTALASALGQVSPELGGALMGHYQTAVDLGAMDQAVAQKEPDGKAVIDLLAGGLSEAMEACAPDGDAGPVFMSMGGAIEAAFRSKADRGAIEAALAFDKKDKDDKRDPGAAAELLKKAALAAVAKAAALPPPKGEQAEEPGDANVASAFKKALGDKGTIEALQAAEKVRFEEELYDELEEAEENAREFDDQLTLIDEAGDLMAQQNTIERLIAEIQKERKWLELASGSLGALADLASTGTSMAKTVISAGSEGVTGAASALTAEVLPAIKLAKLILKFSVNIVKAVERINLLRKFEVQVERAIKSGSPLSTAIRGFFSNKKEQVKHATIQDALLAVQIAGAALEVSHYPPAMAAGKLVGAVAKGSAAVEGLIYDLADESSLREGWKVTKEAYRNPKNRRNGLKALELNTTLGIQAVAWAARELGDPDAEQFLKACGLNARTLALNTSTEAKIRDYLETVLHEDRVFMDTEKIATNWQPSPIEASFECWVKVVGRARTKAEPKLDSAPTPSIDALFKAIDKDREALKVLIRSGAKDRLNMLNAGLPAPTEVEFAYQRALELAKAIDGYKPASEAGKPHDEMEQVAADISYLVNEWQDSLGVVLVQADRPLPIDIPKVLEDAKKRYDKLPRGAAVKVFAQRAKEISVKLVGPDAAKQQAPARKLLADSEDAAEVYATWDGKLKKYQEIVGLLVKKKHPKATEMNTALTEANKAFDEARAEDGQKQCEILRDLVKAAGGH